MGHGPVEGMIVLGTWINLGGILLGGAVGCARGCRWAPSTEVHLRRLTAGFLAYVGFKLVWESCGGGLGAFFRQLAVALIALSVGSLTGHLLRLQTLLNRLGRLASERFESARKAGHGRIEDGLVAAAIPFCLAPTGVVGALLDGTSGDWRVLAVKGLMDGLGAMGFAAVFGWPVLLAAVPVLFAQGAMTLLAQGGLTVFRDHALLDAFTAVSGLIVASSAVVVLGVRRVPLANYPPALAYGPLLAAWWR